MRILKAFWKPIAWALIVLILSALSGEKVSQLPLVNIPNMDKVVHFGMYFMFTFLMMWDFARYKNGIYTWKQIIFFSLLSAIIYGGLMELLQSIPTLHRSTDIKDFLANSTGAMVAVLLFKPASAFIKRLLPAYYKAKS